jgi:signal transduction histidine kinase/ActR/RegA family two-component response regulator
MQKDPVLLANVLDRVPVTIFVTTLDGQIRYSNSFSDGMFNTTASTIAGGSIIDFMNEHNAQPSFTELFDFMRNGELDETTIILEPASGSKLVFRVHSFLISTDKSENNDFVAIVFRDVTSEIQVHDQIEKKNIEMAKMNSELIRSNAELKKLSEMKSNFLSIASHELKTPLTSIKGYSDIIIDNMKEKIDSGVYRMIESINRAADRLHRVVNNILDVTRIEQKRLKLKPEFIDLNAVANDCIEELAQFTLKRSISFSCKAQEGMSLFYGDKMRMQQVFTNLFSNAIKYSPDGSKVEVSIYPESSERIHIAVKDYGIGIDKCEQKNIFDPFYEVGNANRHSTDAAKFMGGGTGLGLSIVKGIVERHGGRIWVDSEGVRENTFPGSEFHIVLPQHSEISWDDDETKSLVIERNDRTDEADMVAVDINEKPTILFIDNDREAVEIARMVLETAFEVLVAENGETGLTLAFQRHPSVILMDSYLPGLDGYRICRLLRTQDETRDTPIAFFSAGTQNSEIQKCFASGADDFIVKPFSGRELVDKIWRLLMKKKEEETFK